MVLINVEKYFRVHCRACCGERIKEEAKQLGAYIERYDYFENKHTGVTRFIFDAHCSEKEFTELMKHFDEDKEIITVFTK